MGDAGARLMGRKEAPTTLKESVNGIIARVSVTMRHHDWNTLADLNSETDRRGFQGELLRTVLAARRWIEGGLVSWARIRDQQLSIRRACGDATDQVS